MNKWNRPIFLSILKLKNYPVALSEYLNRVRTLRRKFFSQINAEILRVDEPSHKKWKWKMKTFWTSPGRNAHAWMSFCVSVCENRFFCHNNNNKLLQDFLNKSGIWTFKGLSKNKHYFHDSVETMTEYQ